MLLLVELDVLLVLLCQTQATQEVCLNVLLDVVLRHDLSPIHCGDCLFDSWQKLTDAVFCWQRDPSRLSLP